MYIINILFHLAISSLSPYQAWSDNMIYLKDIYFAAVQAMWQEEYFEQWYKANDLMFSLMAVRLPNMELDRCTDWTAEGRFDVTTGKDNMINNTR